MGEWVRERQKDRQTETERDRQRQTEKNENGTGVEPCKIGWILVWKEKFRVDAVVVGMSRCGLKKNTPNSLIHDRNNKMAKLPIKIYLLLQSQPLLQSPLVHKPENDDAIHTHTHTYV